MAMQLEYLREVYGQGNGRPSLLRILTYHRVDHPEASPHLNPGQISATPADFSRQMAYLSAHYAVVSARDVISAFKNNAPLPANAVLITFDDACVDFATHAYPVLKRLELPALVFVPTAFPDHPERGFWWDRLYRALFQTTHTELSTSPVGALSLNTPDERRAALRRVQRYLKERPHEDLLSTVARLTETLGVPDESHQTVLSWNALQQMAKEGLISFGAHTRTHPILTQVSLEQASSEIHGSLQDLRERIPASVPAFAFPNGNYNTAVLQCLSKAGAGVGVTTTDGFNNINSANYLALRRINITRRTSPALFRLRLQRWFSYLDVYRHSA